MLFEAGPVDLSWAALDGWQRLTGANLSPDEYRLLRELSGVYASALSSMAEPDAVPMHLKDDPEHQEQREADMIDYLRSLGDGAQS